MFGTTAEAKGLTAEAKGLDPVKNIVKSPLPHPSNLLLTVPKWFFCCGSLQLCSFVSVVC